MLLGLEPAFGLETYSRFFTVSIFVLYQRPVYYPVYVKAEKIINLFTFLSYRFKFFSVNQKSEDL